MIFGCTEITLLLSADDSSLPVFDTTELHAGGAVDFIVAETPAMPVGVVDVGLPRTTI